MIGFKRHCGVKLIGMSIITILVGVGVSVTAISSRRILEQKTQGYRSKGVEFGKHSDQLGCIHEGLLRARSITRESTDDSDLTGYFVTSCLLSSRTTFDFCNDIPATEVMSWERSQCEAAGSGEIQVGCMSIIDAKVRFCREHR